MLTYISLNVKDNVKRRLKAPLYPVGTDIVPIRAHIFGKGPASRSQEHLKQPACYQMSSSSNRKSKHLLNLLTTNLKSWEILRNLLYYCNRQAGKLNDLNHWLEVDL